MIYIETNSLDATYNLALEEYCLLELKQFPEIMMLWQNENAVIVGRYQTAEREINVAAAREVGAQVVRRSSGGGTVYHDMGNLNYTFILEAVDPKRVDLKTVAKPVVSALAKLGVQAEIQGRNDIVVDGRKVSGTAQRIARGRLLHHGTLLFDSDLDVLQRVLHVDEAKVASKGVASIKSRVTNIREHIPGEMNTIQDFWRALLEAFDEELGLERWELTDDDLARVKALQEAKYQAWDWSMGRAPAFEYSNSRRFPGGRLEVRLNVRKGRVDEIEMNGDFLGLVALDDLLTALGGVRYHPDDVRAALGALDLPMYLGAITADEVVEVLFEDVVLGPGG